MEMKSDYIDSSLRSCETIEAQGDKQKPSLSKGSCVRVGLNGEAELGLLQYDIVQAYMTYKVV